MTSSRPSLPVRLAAAGGTLLLLAACGTTNSGEDRLGKFLVAPGKYRLFDCQQLTQQSTYYVFREKELRDAKAKAESGPGGQFVSEIAYGSEYGQVRGNIDELRREATEKKCNPFPRGLMPGSATPGTGSGALR